MGKSDAITQGDPSAGSQRHHGAFLVAGTLLAGLLALLITCPLTNAAVWRLAGPARPPAGETVTYVLRGPPGWPYDVVVFAGPRVCPDTLLSGDPSQTQSSNGFLDAGGADAQQFSFSRGRATICAYNDIGTAVAGRAIRTTRGRDRVRITVARQPNSPDDDALVTATGYVGRVGQSPFADAADQHVGTVIVTAITPPARCPKAPPSEYAPDTNSASVGTAHYSVDVTITNAFEVSRNPRLCAYLTAARRVLGTVRTRTVARNQTRIGSAKSHDATSSSTGVSDTDKRIARVIAWILVGLVAAGIVMLIRRAGRSATAAVAKRSAVSLGDTPPGSDTPSSSDTSDSLPAYDFVQRRRDEEVGFAIQRAVGATADVHRYRLRVILEHQDGPEWLDAFNRRRTGAMLAAGRRPPEQYAVFEPRAVINCLAYDPAALQVIGLDAVQAARRLSGLANAAHHPDPDNPLTNADYQRAWRLYTEITGYAAPFDPYAR
jgi:hypothetical protein